jgi:hypothetical protein
MRPIEQAGMYIQDRMDNIQQIRQDRQTRQSYKSLQNTEDSFTRQIQREEVKATPGMINKMKLRHDQRVANRADRKMDRAEVDYLKTTQRETRDTNRYYNQAERKSISTYNNYTRAVYSPDPVDFLI